MLNNCSGAFVKGQREIVIFKRKNVVTSFRQLYLISSAKSFIFSCIKTKINFCSRCGEVSKLPVVFVSNEILNKSGILLYY